jgi:DNA-binding NtrC family response regulator
VASHVTIVHIDDRIAEDLADAIRRNGHDVACFTDPMAALRFLEATGEPSTLITGIRFGLGRLHGIALGLMARRRHAGTKILFISEAEDAEHAHEVGRVVAAGTAAQDVAEALEQLLLED